MSTSIISNTKIENFASKVKLHIPVALQYSAVYWGYHLARIEIATKKNSVLWADINDICEKKALFWLEVVSLLNAIEHGLYAAEQLELWENVSI